MGKKRNGQNIICKACGNQFYVPNYRKDTAKFCSLICQNHKQYEQYKFICFQCKKECNDSPSRKEKRKFCCLECYNIFQVDKKSDQKERRRLSIASAREKGLLGNTGGSIRKYIFSIKDQKCEICGYNEYKSCLDIHHIDSNPNNNTTENLSILCVMCHRKVHRNILTIRDQNIVKKPRRFARKNQKLNDDEVKMIK